MSKNQEINFSTIPKKERRVARRVKRILQKKMNAYNGHESLIKRIILLGWGKIDFIEEYDKMCSWCEMKRKKVSVLRFNNWVKHAVEWKKNKQVGWEQRDEIEKYEREKSERQLNELREKKRSVQRG